MTEFNTSIVDYRRDVAELRRLDAEVSEINKGAFRVVYRLVLVSERTIAALMEDGSRVTDLERGPPAMYAIRGDGSAVFYPPPPVGFVPKLYVEFSEPTAPELPPPPETVYKPNGDGLGAGFGDLEDGGVLADKAADDNP